MAYTTLVDVILHNSKRDDRGVTFIKGVTDEKFLSYQSLLQNALRYLGQLRAANVQEHDELVFQVDDNETFITVFWACLLGKIVAVPLSTGNEDSPRSKLVRIWEQLNNPCLVIDDRNWKRLEMFSGEATGAGFLERIKERVLTESYLHEGTVSSPVSPVAATDIAFLQYSSGSTGHPKGSILTHAGLLVNTGDIMERARITAEDRSMSWLPLSHDFGLICVYLTNVLAGMHQYMMANTLFLRRPLLWLEKTSQHKATLLYTPNFGFQYLLSAVRGKAFTWDLSAVRLIFNGAEPIIKEVCDDFFAALAPYGLAERAMYPVYGLAEATVGVSFPDPSDPFRTYCIARQASNVGDTVELLDGADRDRGVTFVEVGYPLAHCHVRIVNDAGQPVAGAVIGHIQIQGPNVIAGYYNEPERAKEIFTEDNWLRTGDLGFLHGNRLIITGRHKNIIIINGQNYYPQDLEMALQEVEGIEYGKVVACGIRTDDRPGEELAVFVLFKGADEEFSALKEKVKEKIFRGFGLMTDRVVAVRKLPKTTSGKLQHFRLKELYQMGEFDASAAG